ncbi:MAG TPA: HRDC domain-containing protein, partial [Candidatus Aquilonibacter sp.]|nr:HRDC domain-containing protein [Candidatus Aquilonibacter sp.]
AGRAGRDGQPADCLMLWQKRDTALLVHFTKEIADEAERQRAWQRYDEIKRFVEPGRCRHHGICAHFGENPKWKTCSACDTCSGEPEWLAPPAKVAAVQAPATAGRGKSAKKPGGAATTTDVDPDLREYLREWRRTTAKESGTAAFIIMHDTSLDELCRRRPQTLAELLQVPGFGERKAELYGEQILSALKSYGAGGRAVGTLEPMSKPAEETMRLLAEGRTFAEIAEIRGRQVSSVVAMVADLVQRGEIEFEPKWLGDEKRVKIEAACGELGVERLRALKDALPEDITFDEIKLVAARLRRQQSRQAARAGR